ncbi:sigma 54-interacting transcriptional regulator [uncultured Chitinophaga sp.]|jgi:Transcriptional regulator containing GAF, AAA-type ATPase, and DNA binding domains|uniref:sigma-54-dependent Fis family transcriptional regulator n=1 Tax=uncultured Chitinophaga sp. TaxID=339340 RepID=UPI002614C893|nr:sigma 54-interacting transcriptional regulator [uncultured Chitinophaga sp.]
MNKINNKVNNATPDERIHSLEKERGILLALGDDITKIREKDDLLRFFSSRIRERYPFSHTIVTLIEQEAQTYAPFLLDHASSAIRYHAAYPAMVAGHFSLNEPFIQTVLANNAPTAFILEDVMDEPDSPPYLRVNYEGGIREILMTPLKNQEQTFGFLHMYAKDTTSFTSEFKEIIGNLALQISNAVMNIIKNEEIAHEKWLNEVLLSLSNEMVKVRDRQDLLRIISSSLREVIGFSHGMMTVMDESADHYKAWLIDAEARLMELTDSGDALYIPTTTEDGIYDIAALYYKPLVFDMQLFDPDSTPLWFKLHYEAGAREMIVKILGCNGSSKYSLILFADKPGTFKEEAANIIQRICSQLYTAVSNIAANEEIRERENEKSFLLDFSSDIAAVRSKDDLSYAVNKCLKKLNMPLGYVILKRNEEQGILQTYIHDGSTTANDHQYAADAPLQKRVLDSEIPLLFSVTAELNKGVDCPHLRSWKKMGIKTMVGTPLRTGDETLGIFWLGVDEMNIPLLQGMCDQISVAMHNIMSNDEILRREKEQSLLLEFSHDVSRVHTKDDLKQAISRLLKKMWNTKLIMLRIIEDDGVTLSAYIYDENVFDHNRGLFHSLAAKTYDITERRSARVLNSDGPVIFNVAEETQVNDGSFAQLWKGMNLTNAVGAPLRAGNVDLGIIWLLTNEINLTILRGICAHISIAVSNIRANEKILAYKQKLEMENDYLREQIKTIYNFSEIVGSGATMQRAYHLMSQVADTNSTVLLLGETGTGKELIARAIHNASSRKNKLMVKVNCAALPAHLIESELFGHERGAFTGAVDKRIGKFELANHSTLFLDEIGEMPLELQVKLLRVLQERELERIGGKTTIKLDVRIIAATNRNLEAEVQAGRFRSDLYYRLNVFPINLPPLRERPEDIEQLAYSFLAKFSKNIGKRVTGISSGVLRELRSYHWPGNVRELEHLVERSILLCEGQTLTEIHLPGQTLQANNGSSPEELHGNGTLEQMEKAHIIGVLKRCSGKISGAGGAAEILEIPGTTLHSKMKKLGISKADYFTR